MTTHAHTDLFSITNDEGWRLTVEGWDPKAEPAIEAVLALVNGYQGTRAAVEEGSRVSTPATFLNGVFDVSTEQVAQAAATPDHVVIAAPTQELVVAPDWSRLRLIADSQPLDLESAELLSQRRTLDLHRGVLLREWRLRVAGKTTRLRSLRCASLDDRHVLIQLLEFTPEDWSGTATIEALVEGNVTNEGGVRHLVGTQTGAFEGGLLLTTATSEKQIPIAYATHATLTNAEGDNLAWDDVSTPTTIIQRWQTAVSAGQPLLLQKIVTVWTGRDDADPVARAQETLRQATHLGVSRLLERSAAAWAERWAVADVVISANQDLQRRARFAIYHLIGCANPDDEYASPGARSLTGERYKGHVFWDTEIFVLPFFVYTHPPTARTLLMYRYHTLPAARAKAQAQGYQGALYAWESTDTGEDVTPPFVINAAGERLEILTAQQEHHISADVAYAIWQYWHATGDDAFMLRAGAEMLIELARFWASRATLGDDGRYHILKVIGPDEFHEHVDDNAYTNRMAQWVLRRGQEIVAWLRERHPQRWQELAAQLAFSDDELTRWREVADGLVDNFDPTTGLFEQHRGYFQLEDVDLRQFEPRKTSMDVLLGWERLSKTQIIKQADVIMLLFLLGDRYPREVHAANFRYYEPRTAHDSSLSASFHALAAARMDELELAERYWLKASNIDLDFTRGVTAAGGIHIATLGGMWQALIFGFGGMFVEQDGPRFEPHVPEHWGELRFTILWRGQPMRVTARGTSADVQRDGAT
ncbi:glycoside hydrolase family 65 protein [Kallotenue papyrolyticum]|uniref:glycoside hydrolase family 65 protein n=1 Tax=Kallotenue papyrolyticum TaxID=1325125 RepID=UPI00049295AD|nr:glycoside hydrolase family 65 protein [Kallotenue papyrolyticum]